MLLQYGTVVFWGINAAEEQGIVHAVINPCKVEPLELSDVEIDEFEFNYSLLEPPHIQNDVITINKGYAADHQVRGVRGVIEQRGGAGRGAGRGGMSARRGMLGCRQGETMGRQGNGRSSWALTTLKWGGRE